MIEQDKADLARGDPNILDGLPANVSTGVVNHNGWRKTASPPTVLSSLFSHGPESALKKINIEFFTLVLIGLLLMIHLANKKFTDGSRKFSTVWTLCATLAWQLVHSRLRRSS